MTVFVRYSFIAKRAAVVVDDGRWTDGLMELAYLECDFIDQIRIDQSTMKMKFQLFVDVLEKYIFFFVELMIWKNDAERWALKEFRFEIG